MTSSAHGIASRTWSLPFLQASPFSSEAAVSNKYALIILNQPFSFALLRRLWNTSDWHCCADGGANRLHDTLQTTAPGADDGLDPRSLCVPDLIKGDLDSLRPDVKEYYQSRNVPVVFDEDQYSTDLMKCVESLAEKERSENCAYDVIILGGLSGRLDQTVHTLSYVHKLRNSRARTFVITDDNAAWVLDEGEHKIHIDHSVLGPTCGLLPLGVDTTVLTTTGLRWNLTDCPSSFDGMVSTSNHLVPEEDTVYVKTTKPIWWSVELRRMG